MKCPDKQTLLTEYMDGLYNLSDMFSSFDEYHQYVRCVSSLCVGDTIYAYVEVSGLLTYGNKTSRTVKGIVLGIKSDRDYDHIILIGTKDPCAHSFYSIGQTLYDSYTDRLTTNIKDWKVFYIRPRKEIETRIAKIEKKSLINKV